MDEPWVNLKIITTKLHCVGLKCKPAQRAARSKIGAWYLNDCRDLRAEPKSSAQTLVTSTLGSLENLNIKSMKELQHKRNKIELRGHPVLTLTKSFKQERTISTARRVGLNGSVQTPNDFDKLFGKLLNI